MVRTGHGTQVWLLIGIFCAFTPARAPRSAVFAAQNEGLPVAPLVERGTIQVEGRPAHYLVRRLPASSFPELPEPLAALLDQRGCLIPQTYEAHRPENVVRASLERAGSSDWAVLCSQQGTVSLLVFFGSNLARPQVLASAPETERLQQHDPSGVLGFSWGIDPVTPESIHERQSGMERRPPRVDHDALADSVIEHRTVYHFYAKSAWTVLDVPEE